MKIKKILSAVISAAISASMLFTMDAGAAILYPLPESNTTSSTSEHMWCVLELEGDPVSRYEQAKKMGVHDFILTDEGKEAYETIMQEHTNVLGGITELIGRRPDVKYDYTAAFNGISAALTDDELNAVDKKREELGIKRINVTIPAYSGSINKVYGKAENEKEKEKTDYSQLTRKIAELTGISDVSEKGEGMLIAVIDSEFDISHEYFTPSEGIVKRITAEDIMELKPYLAAGSGISDSCFVSDKIPFAYNYEKKSADTFISFKNADSHGTHVAGIAAGNGQGVSGDNKKYGMSGAAPEAQLLLLSVFGNQGTVCHDTFAAYDDALYLGADVINASYGLNVALPYHDGTSFMEYEAVSNIADTGTVFCTSAGNCARFALGEHTDYSSGNSPDQERDILSVASAQNPIAFRRGVRLADGSAAVITGGNMNLWESIAEQEFEYVMVPGIGDTEDFEGIDVKGKVAVINRGTLDFVEKEKNAADRGAAAVIYVNYEHEECFDPMYENLPTAMISYNDGKLLAEQSTKTLKYKKEPVMIASDDIYIDDYSSWDYTETLDLKPDIAAFGSDIYSSIADVSDNHKSYEALTGTSMAAPQFTGMNALLLQYLRENKEKYGVTDRSGLSRLAAQLFMSTAQPIHYKNTKQTASPRVQGNGLANVKNAMETPCYISTNSARDSFRPKLSLGDGYKDKYTLEFNITNIGSKAYGYSPQLMLFRDDFDEDGNVKDALLSFNKGAYYDVVYRDDTGAETKRFVVKKSETKTFTAEITLSEAAFGKIKADGGAFVDGFLRLVNKDIPDLTLSFMAFDGEFGKVSDNGVFLKFMYGCGETYNDYMLNGQYSGLLDGNFPMGVDPIDQSVLDTVYVSPNDDGVYDRMVLSTLINRRCYNMKAVITDKNGDTVYKTELGDIGTVTDEAGNPIYFSTDIGYDFKENGKAVNNAEYTLTLSAEVPMSGDIYSVSQKIVVDTKAPTVKSVGLLKTDTSECYIIEADDNCAVSGACTEADDMFIADIDDAKLGNYMIVPKPADPSNNELYGETNYVNYAEVYDMAGNFTAVTDEDVSYTLDLTGGEAAYAAEGDEQFILPFTVTDENGNTSGLEVDCKMTVAEFEEEGYSRLPVYVNGYYLYTADVKIGVMGDANGDDKCDVRDAAYIARLLAGDEDAKKDLIDSMYGYFGDFNRDGSLNVRDAAAIARKLAAQTTDDTKQEEAA